MKFKKTILYTNTQGFAEFRQEEIDLDQGSEQARLCALQSSQGYQLRQSPVGFKSDFHVTTIPQWVFILSGEMQIGLQDGSTQTFAAGQHFFSADLLPEGAVFDDKVHGHCSRQAGDQALVTAFVRA